MLLPENSKTTNSEKHKKTETQESEKHKRDLFLYYIRQERPLFLTIKLLCFSVFCI